MGAELTKPVQDTPATREVCRTDTMLTNRGKTMTRRLSNGTGRTTATFTAVIAAVLATAADAIGAEQATGIFVNSMALAADTVQALQRLYPVPIAPGRYWYDAVSGAYGIEGGPVTGQMSPGLRLGGALRADASAGTSGVFINGRQLTQGEKAYIEQTCRTPVARGRYSVDARGIGGFEGMLPSFDLRQCGADAGQGQARGSSTRTFCDPDGSCRSTGILGSILTVPPR